MINTRNEALRTLGLTTNAKESDIKAAYKSLVKIYHPDTGNQNVSVYQRITEAYEFLCNDTKGYNISNQRIVGNSAVRHGNNSDYATWEKKVRKHQEEKNREFEKKVEEYSKQKKKQDEEYKKAMDAIHAIRAAQAIEAMIKANGIKKDGK
ncbi:MAG: J domain-containing protein [Pseudobutyrivibrio sp.]|nr:J domain-containing protein [Pseudobutyrivibrio sp.]